MKRFFLLLFVVSFGIMSCDKKKEAIQQENVVTALFSETEIVVDGLLNESAWQKAKKIHLKDSDKDEEVKDSTFSTYALTCYDENNLYIAFVSNDKDIYSNFTGWDQHLWEEEAVEVFIDVDDDPNTYIEIELSPLNILFDSYIVDPFNINIEETSKFNFEGIRTAVSVEGTVNIRHDEDKRWTCEIAVPFVEIVEDFNTGILKTAEWKINYYRIDRDADGPVHYAWSPTRGRFHQPSMFGILVFK